ncbi:hypothetical protein OHA45_37005 [Streptomyces lydicus]|uniref:hypothetical protein n=1 Tax=Streptomyces lydicus TaxID=47763 RepID=UPI002E308D42|nr:hypothetical protein [Streptomyces lydicus]
MVQAHEQDDGQDKTGDVEGTTPASTPEGGDAAATETERLSSIFIRSVRAPPAPPGPTTDFGPRPSLPESEMANASVPRPDYRIDGFEPATELIEDDFHTAALSNDMFVPLAEHHSADGRNTCCVNCTFSGS